MKKYLIIALLLFSKIVFCQDDKTSVLITDPDNKFEIIGDLGVKLGTTVTVAGKIVEVPRKGIEGGQNLLIESINDSAIQKVIFITLIPYWGEFGEGDLPEIETGATYIFRGYESGRFIGVPFDAYDEAGIILQTASFYFHNDLVIISGKRTKEINWSPADFVGRKALLSGTADNLKDTAYIIGEGWKLKLIGAQKWNEDEIGKEAEVFGKIQATDKEHTYYIVNPEPRLVKLEDLLNKEVKLRGTAISLNCKWWFDYRGTDIYVENMNQLPGWKVENHFQTMEISGVLKLIDSEGIDSKAIRHSYCQSRFVIVNATWKPIDGLLIPELEKD